MQRIIKAIEEKLEAQECTIYVQKHEIEELKRKLAEAEEIINHYDRKETKHETLCTGE